MGRVSGEGCGAGLGLEELRTERGGPWMDSKLSEARSSQHKIEGLHARLNDLLQSLDKAELHGAAAYVSMALDSIQRDYPEISSTR